MPHTRFPWDHCGSTSSLLQPGSAKQAGMMKEPLLQIDAMIEKRIADGIIPGAVTFVARCGHIVQHEAYGHACLYEAETRTMGAQPILMKKDTIFDLASISKIFTTTAAMRLYEDGFLHLDDPVINYIPEFAGNGKENITIKQLMTHTSGFTSWVPLYNVAGNREERLGYVFNYPLANAPGSTYTYSDLNMIILGAMIEKISGRRLDEYISEKITIPLNMDDTMYHPHASLRHRIAATEYQQETNRGLIWGQVHDENAWVLDGVAGHAGVFSTANDLAKFAQMMLNDGKYGGKRILTSETIQLLVDNQVPEFPGNDHGLGWELSQGWYMDALSEPSTIGHTGFTGTSLVINRNNDTIAILLTNRVHPSRDTVSINPLRREFARQVAGAIPVRMPAENKGAWFSGYGDQLNRVLILEATIENEAMLSYNTWYQIEQDKDCGIIEISSGGDNWKQVSNKITGNSGDFQSKTISIPAGTTHIRFRYHTDGAINGHGWYVTNIKLTDIANQSLPFNLVSTEWQKRNH
ncbi:serine hydrolase [Oceanobacillus arenosus]|uniref:Serine hydrolase n=1 Tax=Oceanobacillus arenosus TaxID=1229153 RepID=A0A3D8PN81_9BACI|nr:serine hydrolase domain-containing protein [Oceanobacillus arenosus]RDW16977.1 serine hydrolase [Oceanobacillus arenosus]